MSVDTDNQGAEPILSLRTLSPAIKEFEAGGNTYYVESALSIERYKQFQKLEIELGFNYNFAGLYEKIKNAYEKQNDRKYGDVSVILYQLMEGAVAIDEKRPVALYLSTLFVNRADEDRTTWSESLAKSKLKDWEDIDSAFFLTLGHAKVSSFGKSMKEIFQMMQSVGDLDMEEMRKIFSMDEDPLEEA